MKLCCKCKIEKEVSEFYANKRAKDGLNSFCILCHKADNIARKARNRKDPEFKEREIAKKRLYNAKTSEYRKSYMKVWHSKNKEDQLSYQSLYRELNKEYFQNYRKINKAKINARTRKRQAALLQRTPKWIDVVDCFEMECVYVYCGALRSVGLQYEVDHIIPLQGKAVSGLHVPSNLQVIHQFDNRSKANRMEI